MGVHWYIICQVSKCKCIWEIYYEVSWDWIMWHLHVCLFIISNSNYYYYIYNYNDADMEPSSPPLLCLCLRGYTPIYTNVNLHHIPALFNYHSNSTSRLLMIPIHCSYSWPTVVKILIVREGMDCTKSNYMLDNKNTPRTVIDYTDFMQ